MEDRLILICDGNIHTVEYIVSHGLYPSALVFEPLMFQEMAPYLRETDDILLIVKGLTDFTLKDIYSLLSKFKEYEGKYNSVTVLSNMDLGYVENIYYKYSGDLFYSSELLYVDRKKYFNIDIEGNILENNKKKKYSYTGDSAIINPILNKLMSKYGVLSESAKRMKIYGKNSKEIVKINNSEYLDNITIIDMYKDKKKRVEDGGTDEN